MKHTWTHECTDTSTRTHTCTTSNSIANICKKAAWHSLTPEEGSLLQRAGKVSIVEGAFKADFCFYTSLLLILRKMWCYSSNQNSSLKRSQLKLPPKIVKREIKPKKQTNKNKPLITKSNYWTGQRCSARFFLNVQPIFLGQFLIPGWAFIRSEYLKRFPLVLQNAAWNEGCALAEDWPIRGFCPYVLPHLKLLCEDSPRNITAAPWYCPQPLPCPPSKEEEGRRDTRRQDMCSEMTAQEPPSSGQSRGD